jgi:hypothetical protein
MTSAVTVDIGAGQIVTGVMEGLDSLFTSDAERAAARIALETQLQKPQIINAMTNLKAAEHANWFVAGARPSIVWICAAGWFFNLIWPSLITAVAFFFDLGVPMMPEIDGSVLLMLTGAVLGYRSFEKVKGVAREDNPTLSMGSLSLKPNKFTPGGLY